MRIILTIPFLIFAIFSRAQTQPKLIVGIVVDQMRYDYLYKFSPYFGDAGFKRLMKEGHNFHNNHYSYIPTYTGPGHATIFSGTTPSQHGIIANSWYCRETKRKQYCVADTTFKTVGSTSGAGQMSPRQLMTNTLGDAFKLFYGDSSKVFGVSMKDRGAILSAGHMANAAYWFDGGKFGHWISSTYYMKELPNWVTQFNQSDRKKGYLNGSWTLSSNLKPLQHLDAGLAEGRFQGVQQSVFPYDLSKLAPLNGNYSLLKAVPMGNDLTLDFALELIENEQLGTDEVPDLLALSFSGTDYIGHQFGTQSLEVMDAYVKLDRTMARLLNRLDEQVGSGNYLIFLTADHGAIPPPKWMETKKLPFGLARESVMESELDGYLADLYGTEGLVESLSNGQVYINDQLILENALYADEVETEILNWLSDYPGVDWVYQSGQLVKMNPSVPMVNMLIRGFHPHRSGDILFTLKPGWANYGETGSTHGSGYAYDTHVPLTFYGTGVKPGNSYGNSGVVDIVSTISTWLHITMPNAACGHSFAGEIFQPH